MTGPFSVRRRADEFNSALSDPSTPLTERDARQFANLLAVVRDLRSIPQLQPRPEFVADLRSRLMVEAETALLPQSVGSLTAAEQRISLPVRARSRDRRVAAVLGGAALIGATASMAVAAQPALPGESLYPVKRALEDVETRIAGSDAAKGEAMLAHAQGRLDEIDELADRSNLASQSAIGSTLDTFSDQASEASSVLLTAYDETGDEAVIIDLRTFAETSIDRLATLQSALPVSSREELVAAAERLSDIDRRASEVCPACGGVPASIPSNLLAGVVSSQDVGWLIVASSEDPALNKPFQPEAPAVTPAPISGQDVDGVEVPDLTVPDPGATTTPTPTSSPTNGNGTGKGTGTKTREGTKLPGAGTDVQQPVNEVTKLLTGDLDDATSGLPVTNEVTNGVGTAVDGTLEQLDDTLDGISPPTLP
ncbi:MAG: hypothetical protein JWN68_3628 [Nocardioides sp.]|jgi:hypothetical protein|uniref:DUF5667 domain-containing protein n=1 Tax=Nocardioides sp. TaxID=35761 RepID=UPI0026351629|nr:DUF5667 domain-containing protein [Nocardioides sp.]MCW2835675.1 hypothetical protein [Nocardioides sp.]